MHFHTIKSILNFEAIKEVMNRFMHFHTIKSILNLLNALNLITESYFHTIKSILNA